MINDINENQKDKSLLNKIWRIAIVIGTIVTAIGGIQGVVAYSKTHNAPAITINNHLALPILVVVNDSPPYTYRIEADSKRTVTLLSEADFPAKLHWTVIRNKNTTGNGEIGEALSGDYLKIDKGRNIDIINIMGTNVYFYPVIQNNLDVLCQIVINDGLTIEETIGFANPHRVTNITGYFNQAKNSNLTLYCDNKPYWIGERKGISPLKQMHTAPKSGVAIISVP